MSPLNCTQVLDEIDLYAAGEGDAEMRAAIARHVDDCPACAAALEEARELVGLVSLQLRETGAMERGLKRIHAEVRQRRVSRGVLVLRAAAVAAMMLLTVGLYFWLADLREPRRHGTDSLVAANLGVGRHAIYSAPNNQEILVDRGEVLVRVPPADSAAQPFTVRTPGGIASAERAEFLVDVSGTAPVAVRVLSGKVTIHNEWGQIEAHRGESVLTSAKKAPWRQVEDLGLRFSRLYVPVKVKRTAGVPPLQLPLNLSEIANLPAQAKTLPTLQTEGFARVAHAGGDDLAESYRILEERNSPVMMTSDLVLHGVRLQMANLLRDLEERHFAFDLARLTSALLTQVADQKMPAPNAAEWQEARKLALTYLAVGERLLHPEAETPDGVDAAVIEVIVKAIEAGQTQQRLPGFDIFSDLQDFRPTGDYASSETLKRYFRARMWFGRVPLVLMGGTGWRQTMAAALITIALPRAMLADGRSASAVWERLDTVTSFFAGSAAQPGPSQYAAALPSELGELAEPAGWARFNRDLPQYLPRPFFAKVRNAAPGKAPAELLDSLAPNTGFHLLSQRSAVDSLALSQLVYPHVGTGIRKTAFTAVALPDGQLVRGLPRGLDLMSLLGNKLAGEFLHRTGDDGAADGAARLSYQAASSRLRTDFSQFDLVEWNRDLYWAWLSVLDPLLRDPALGSPTCMASPAYQATRLNSALASWTQLRIDTALYTRKADLHALKPDALKGHELAVAPALQRGGEVAAYLEPLPELYGRLLALTRMTAKELQSLDLLTDDASQRLSALEQVLAVLLALAEKELDNESLSAAEQETLRRLPERLGQLAGGEISGPMVVTVATDATGAWVLQEAVGRPDLAMFVIRLPDARLVVFTGAVQSYYEFKRPRAAALTRESWLELLRAPPGPSRPEWLRN